MRFSRNKRTGSHTAARVARSFQRVGDGHDYYEGVVVGAGTIGVQAMDSATRDAAAQVLGALDEDDYLEYLRAYLAEGARFVGERWRYADIVTVLAAAAELLQPSSYLEIGVRQGRSMAVVASRVPNCSIIGIDLWLDDYAGMENPGPDHVRAQLGALGFEGDLEFLSGSSHQLVPQLFRERPELSFDMITIDGDHSTRGARRDLLDVLPRLRVGGVLVFDDIGHPAHPALRDVWTRTVANQRRYSTWEFDEVGYGVALAVRRW